MVVELGTIALSILFLVIGLIILGFAIYLLKNYCQERIKNNRRISADLRRQIDPTKSFMTHEEDSTIKLHTMDQILKQEEKTALAQGKSLNLVAVKFQKPEISKESKSPMTDLSKSVKVNNSTQ